MTTTFNDTEIARLARIACTTLDDMERMGLHRDSCTSFVIRNTLKAAGHYSPANFSTLWSETLFLEVTEG